MNPYIHKLKNGPSSVHLSRKARVEIIPLIDVMFLLVAFFMVVSMSMVMQKGIFVDLSPAETADSSMKEDNSLIVSVDEEGIFYLNKEVIELVSLKEFLMKKARFNKDTDVVINADKKARHEMVVQALDVVRKSGLHNVIFSVEPKE